MSVLTRVKPAVLWQISAMRSAARIGNQRIGQGCGRQVTEPDELTATICSNCLSYCSLIKDWWLSVTYPARKQLLRRAIALMAAYAFFLQAFFATVVITQAYAADAVGVEGAFVLCSSNSHSPDVPADTDVNHLSKCCSICILAHSGSSTIPSTGSTPAWAHVANGPIYAESRSAAVASLFRNIRSGPSRAPPDRMT
jgi:hypothetical protein